MKRLLQISFDTLISSLGYLLVWVILSITVDKSLINIFTILFPIQYLGSIIVSIFGTGANISRENGNKDDARSGLKIGIILSIIIFALISINIDYYLNFMNATASKNYILYGVILVLFHTILNLCLTNLYYQRKNNTANCYSVIFYFLNTILILVTSCFFEQFYFIIIPTLLILIGYLFFIIYHVWEKGKICLNLKRWICFDSVELSNHILLCLAYLFGISITFHYGEEYALILTFTALITDTQWDIASSIGTLAKIEISKNTFNYKEQMKNAYQLCLILALSVIVLFVLLYGYYETNLKITLIFVGLHLVDFLIYPIHKVKTYYLQLKYSASKITTINIAGRILRTILNLLKTPFCTIIAQIGSSIYQIAVLQIIFNKNYTVNGEGIIEKRKENVSKSN